MGLLPWVSSAPEPGAGSVHFPPQARWETRRQRRKRVLTMACGWASRVSDPARWEDGVREACYGSCQREHQSLTPVNPHPARRVQTAAVGLCARQMALRQDGQDASIQTPTVARCSTSCVCETRRCQCVRISCWHHDWRTKHRIEEVIRPWEGGGPFRRIPARSGFTLLYGVRSTRVSSLQRIPSQYCDQASVVETASTEHRATAYYVRALGISLSPTHG
jgi:hypothetical protein